MTFRKIGFFIIAAIGIGAASEANAQFNGPSLAGSVYLDRILRTEESTGEREAEVTPSAAAAAPGVRESETFWKRPVLTTTYAYGRRDFETPGDNERDSHQIQSIVHLENRRMFSTELGVSYVRTADENNLSDESDGNSFVLTLNPAQEMLSLIMEEKPVATFLYIGTLVAYRHSEVDGDILGNHYELNSDALSIVPSLTVAQAFSPTVIFSETALYLYETADNDPKGAGSTDGSSGVFGMQTRVDIHIPDVFDAGDIVIIPTAQWNHDVHQDAGGIEDDWADFGLKFRLPLPSKGGLVMAYNLETLRQDYTAHRATLSLEWQL